MFKDTAYPKIRDFLSTPKCVVVVATILSILSIIYSYRFDFIISYGDAESHLNIAKRVVSSITPGFSQLGGIWLPLPHILMIPFVYFDPLWRSGLAGSIVSGFFFIIACLFLYKLTFLITTNKAASFFTFLVFALNPNILYMQSTPMTEIILISLFVLSIYFYIKFYTNDSDFLSLIYAAFFGFLATLTRYEGWLLVLTEAAGIIFLYFNRPHLWKMMEGKFILFSSLALFGIFLWFGWDGLILGDPLYFTNSQFSAKSQQQGWLLRGELPTFHNLPLSILYYTVTTFRNSGLIVFAMFLVGISFYIFFLLKKIDKERFFLMVLMLVPLIFNILTLFIGQSVIFIPDLTPKHFQWNLFNVRYGTTMLPTIALFAGYLFFTVPKYIKALLVLLLIAQTFLFTSGLAPVISLQDGIYGLSSAKRPDAQEWLVKNYDQGLVLLDDYARTISIVRSNIPMQNVIYVGNKPYWEQSLKEPEKYATWIIMQKDDTIWTQIYENPETQARLYKYFQKSYTSPNILIFKRNQSIPVG